MNLYRSLTNDYRTDWPHLGPCHLVELQKVKVVQNEVAPSAVHVQRRAEDRYRCVLAGRRNGTGWVCLDPGPTL